MIKASEGDESLIASRSEQSHKCGHRRQLEGYTGNTMITTPPAFIIESFRKLLILLFIIAKEQQKEIKSEPHRVNIVVIYFIFASIIKSMS